MQTHILAAFFLVQSFAACQQAQDSVAEFAVSSLSNPDAAVPNILFQSTDGGQSWQNVSAGLPADKPVECLLANNGEVVLGFGEVLYRRSSGSAAPVWENEMLLHEGVSDIFPGRAGLYAMNYAKGFSQQVMKGVWKPVFPELGRQTFRAVFESANGAIFVGCDSGIFKSADGGKTWKQVTKEGLMLKMVESEGVLICTSQQGILRSADGGENWEVVVSEGGVGIDVEVVKGGFAEISYNTSSKTRRMRMSEDGGKTWQAIDGGLPPQASISGIKQVGDFLVCGHPDGIMRSADRGKTWQLVLPSVGKKVFNLSVSGGIIYAVPRDGGC